MRVRDLGIFETVMVGCVALLMAAPAQAGEITRAWSCTFTVECFEQEACGETDYEVSVSYDISELKDKPGEGAGTAEIVDPSATRRAVVVHDDEAFVATGFDFESEDTIAPELFQIFATSAGEARLISAVPSAPMLITYHGQCMAGGN